MKPQRADQQEPTNASLSASLLRTRMRTHTRTRTCLKEQEADHVTHTTSTYLHLQIHSHIQIHSFYAIDLGLLPIDLGLYPTDLHSIPLI